MNLKLECDCTSVSLENAKEILENGFFLKLPTQMTYDISPENVGNSWYSLKATFSNKDRKLLKYTFTGFSFGYEGQGSRGLISFFQKFGIQLDPEKVYNHEFIANRDKFTFSPEIEFKIEGE
jgi:hypothetical protein